MKPSRIKSLSTKRSIASLYSLGAMALGLSLAGMVSTATAASFFTPDFSLSNDDVNPLDDVWYVRCAATTQIRADILDTLFADNNAHVSISCIEPAARRGAGEKEIAIPPGQNPSAPAAVTQCRAALITFDCEENDFCDSNFTSEIVCNNQAFNVGPQKRR
ncbi:MAG: hypothetical protein ACREXS_08715 [Gammaproteobacteria bacterium]